MKARLAACVLLYLAAACSSDSGTDNNNPSAVAYAGTFGSPPTARVTSTVVSRTPSKQSNSPANMKVSPGESP